MEGVEEMGMKLLVDHTFTIFADCEGVFAWFRDFSNYPALFPHVLEITEADSLPPGTAGKMYTERALNFLGKEETLSVRILDVDPGRTILVEADNQRVKSIFRFRFEAAGDGICSFHWELHTRYQGVIRLTFLRLGLAILFWGRFKEAQKRLDVLFPKETTS